jgi:hypothetical protein
LRISDLSGKNKLKLSFLIMGGKKRRAIEYGRFNVQSENARGQVKYETPMQQLLFLTQ